VRFRVLFLFFIVVDPLSIGDMRLENLSNYIDQAVRLTASKVRFEPWQKLRFISRLEIGPT
jgi:hypothetical protein